MPEFFVLPKFPAAAAAASAAATSVRCLRFQGFCFREQMDERERRSRGEKIMKRQKNVDGFCMYVSLGSL
jgi:hypothetical protein